MSEQEPTSGWTFPTLQRYLEARMSEQYRYFAAQLDSHCHLDDERHRFQDLAVDTALANAKEARATAELGSDRRFAAVNEMRKMLEDMNAASAKIAEGYMPRVEYHAGQRMLEDKVGILAGKLDRAEGRTAGLNVTWLYIIQFLTAATAFIAIVMQLAHR